MALGWTGRRLEWLSALVVLVIAACGGPDAQDSLEAALLPFTDAQRSLEDFQYKVEGGLSYGDMLNEWPNVSAAVMRSFDDFEIGQIARSNVCDTERYYDQIEMSHADWADTVAAARAYLQEEMGSSAISTSHSHLLHCVNTG